jgi:hypothetical protein
LDELTVREHVEHGVSFRQLFVDDVALPNLLAERTGDERLRGLVPSWLDWSDTSAQGQAEAQYVRSRSEPSAQHTVLPILLCPDDFDFACTTVVVDVIADDATVTWQRFGLDTTGFTEGAALPHYIGGDVTWFDGVGPFVFTREHYTACRDGF